MAKANRVVPSGGGGKLLHVSSIGDNDVLLGRGSGVQYHPGNVAFRRLVQTRKAEYLKAKNYKLKTAIAKEIVDRIRRDSQPPGRFLRQASDCLWEEVEDETAFEKVKQALRQQPRNGGKAADGAAEDEKVMADQTLSERSPTLKKRSAKSTKGDKDDEDNGDKAGGTEGESTHDDNDDIDFGVNKSTWEIEQDLRQLKFDPDEVLPEARKAPATHSNDSVNEAYGNDQIGYFDRLRQVQNANRSNATKRILLSTPNDPRWLSPQLCLIRSQIEVFEATAEDVKVRFKKGGAKQRIPLGLVGIRCIHCAGDPPAARAKGAVLYPNSIRLVHQAVRNWQRYHFGKCEDIPSEVREQLEKYKSSRSHSGAASLQYWVESCKAIGMVDAGDDGGIFLRRRWSDGEAKANVAAIETSAAFAGAEEHSSIALYDDLKTGAVAMSPVPVSHRSGESLLVLPREIGTLAESGPCTLPSDHSDDMVQSNAVSSKSGTSCTLDGPEDAKQHLLGRVQLAYDIVRSTHEIRLVPTVPSVSEASNVRSESASMMDDLTSLGVGLYEWFTGCHPFEGTNCSNTSSSGVSSAGILVGATDSSTDASRKKRGMRSGNKSYTPLKELGFPTSLCDLVSKLLDGNACNVRESKVYGSADEVEEDLRLMIANPDKFLFDVDLEVATGRLDFPRGRLYGRERELSMLLDAYDRVIESNESCEAVMLSGYSGTGKSSLVHLVKDLLEEKDGFFISGKFDKLQQAQPLSAIVAALNEYCDILLARDATAIDEMKLAIEKAIGSDGKILVDLIPNLEKVIGKQSNPLVSVEGKQAQNRLMFLFRRFVQAIANSSHPLILFLDDLQWADTASLELMTSLVTNPSMLSLLFLGSYRDNEVGADHPLTLQLRYIQSSGISVSSIKIGNLDKASVNALVSDTLHLLPRVTLPLADIVLRKTSGNVLFVVQFLKSLCDDGLLRFSLSSRRWEWDLEAIQSKEIADNVVVLLTSKMLRLGPDLQQALRIAACLGCQFEESTVRLIDPDCNGMLACLDAAVNESLMYRAGSRYKFSHDQIQHAAYSLTLEGEQDALHLQIGQSLLNALPREELDNSVFVVVDQLNRGLRLVSDEDEKFQIAELNLRAGQRAMETSSFLPASLYFKAGVSLLNEEAWGDHYQLCLALYTSCAMAEYVLGYFAETNASLEQVFRHAVRYEDKLPAYTVLVTSLGCQGEPFEATEKALEVLFLLGESFPPKADKNELMHDLALTQEMLDKTTEDGILALNVMREKNKVAAMELLKLLAPYTLLGGRQWLLPHIASRMVRLSLSHGVCKASSVGFASYGIVLCGRLNDGKKGYRYGKIALALLDRLEAKEYAARVYSLVYGMITCWVEPLQVSLQSHRHAYDIGMSTGDVESAFFNAFMQVTAGFQSGVELGPLIDEMKKYIREMRNLKQMLPELMTVPILQAALNLTGPCEDPVKLTGEAMDEDSYMESHVERGEALPGFVYLNRMWLAYWFRRYELAAEMAEKRRKLDQMIASTFQAKCSHAFYTGLTSLALARSTGRNTWEKQGHEAIEKMATWAELNPWNCQNKLELLLAENYFLAGEIEKAAKTYDDSISTARTHRFVNEEALACERCAIFHSSVGSVDRAADYYVRAYKCYLEWGAKRKAEHLVELGDVARSAGSSAD